jgi:hypothetical protein
MLPNGNIICLETFLAKDLHLSIGTTHSSGFQGYQEDLCWRETNVVADVVVDNFAVVQKTLEKLLPVQPSKPRKWKRDQLRLSMETFLILHRRLRFVNWNKIWTNSMLLNYNRTSELRLFDVVVVVDWQLSFCRQSN